MDRRSWAFLAMAITLTAGCSAPAPPDSPTATTNPPSPNPPPTSSTPPTTTDPNTPTPNATVGFQVRAPGISTMDLRFPLFWGPGRVPSVRMTKDGDLFSATASFPVGSLIRYGYSVPEFDYDHREQYKAQYEANRLILVTPGLTLTDETYQFATADTPLPQRLKGRIIDNATGEPLVEPWIVADGIWTSALNGTFDIAVRDRPFPVTVFTADGSHRAKAVQAGPGDLEVRLDAAPKAHVRLVPAASPPPHHEVRVYGTAAQFGTPYLINNLHHVDTFQTLKDGALELELHDGQWVDYLYSVGNVVSSYENRQGEWVTRGFVARDGRVVRDEIGTFLGAKTTWFNVTVPSYTDPADVVGISQLDPRLLLMHRVDATHWTLAVSHYDTEGRPYRYYKSWIGIGDEREPTRTARGAAVQDVVDAWKHQSGPVPQTSVAVPAIKNRFDVWAYLPDWYSTTHALNLERIIDRAADDGMTGIVINQVQQYSDIEAPYASQTSQQWALYMPAFEAQRCAELAHAKGLAVMMYTQMGGGEAFLSTGRLFPASWWDNWFRENQRINVHNARLAHAADLDALVFHAKEPGFLMDASLNDDYNAAMKESIAAMRAVFDGTIVVPYDEFHEGQDYWKAGDVVSQGGWSLDLDAKASQSEVDAWAANLLDTRFRPHQQNAGHPMVMHVAAQSVEGALAGKVVPEHEGPHTEVNHQEPLGHEDQRKVYEAFFKAANEREWLGGLFVWVYGPTDAPETRDFDVRGKPAQAVASAWAKAMAP